MTWPSLGADVKGLAPFSTGVGLYILGFRWVIGQVSHSSVGSWERIDALLSFKFS